MRRYAMGRWLQDWVTLAVVLLLATAIFPQLIGHSAMNFAVGYKVLAGIGFLILVMLRTLNSDEEQE